MTIRNLVMIAAALLILVTSQNTFSQTNNWQLVWSDEFKGQNGASVDPLKWRFDTGGNGWGNQELESYTSRTQNADIEGNQLAITAIKENFTGTDGNARQYTSARLLSADLFAQNQGRFEAYIKIPEGQGMWPAFWLLGNDIFQIGWPKCGEVDIMENVGREPFTTTGTIHGPQGSGEFSVGGSYTLQGGQKIGDGYHLFALEWEDGVVRWYVDNNLFKTATTADLPGGSTWVFDHPFFVLLNLAVGGNYPGSPDGTTVFPQKMMVDYVRVYKRGTPAVNPIDGGEFFVRQQYYDFLNRPPDDGGLAYWTDQVNSCTADYKCNNSRRVGVADAFFFEPEFQDSGAYVYRLYRTSFGKAPTFVQFNADRAQVVGGTNLDQSKTIFATLMVGRPEFQQNFPLSLDGPNFIQALVNSVKNATGVDLSSKIADYQAAYNSGSGQAQSRGLALRSVADSQALVDAVYNESFVATEYFGYLRRDPEPDGFQFWLGQMNRFPLRDVGIQQALACSFITSQEYQNRFGDTPTHSNQDCPQ